MPPIIRELHADKQGAHEITCTLIFLVSIDCLRLLIAKEQEHEDGHLHGRLTCIGRTIEWKIFFALHIDGSLILLIEENTRVGITVTSKKRHQTIVSVFCSNDVCGSCIP